jgi:hypothetical protein
MMPEGGDGPSVLTFVTPLYVTSELRHASGTGRRAAREAVRFACGPARCVTFSGGRPWKANRPDCRRFPTGRNSTGPYFGLMSIAAVGRAMAILQAAFWLSADPPARKPVHFNLPVCWRTPTAL